jgi:hypothetical protein
MLKHVEPDVAVPVPPLTKVRVTALTVRSCCVLRPGGFHPAKYGSLQISHVSGGAKRLVKLCVFVCTKVLNFSIAYGKTAHGLSRDWGTSLDEAQDTVDRWYSDRPEVRAHDWSGFCRAGIQHRGLLVSCGHDLSGHCTIVTSCRQGSQHRRSQIVLLSGWSPDGS